jgi:hypothetical protein
VKMIPVFRRAFLVLTAALFFSGLLYFILDKLVNRGPWHGMTLHLHGIIGLIFMVVFGDLLPTHVAPGLQGKVRRKTGLWVLALTGLLLLSVPALYYLTNEDLRTSVALIHTLLGLVVVVPFGIHLLHGRSETKTASRKRSRARRG